MSSQESIDAAVAALKNYVTAQQQQQQQQQPSAAPALQPLTLPLPLQAAPTPAATLQQLLSAAQQQQQPQTVVARQSQPLQIEHQPQHSYPNLDPNMARIAATLMSNALHQAASSAAVPTSSCSTSHGIKVALADNSTSIPAPGDAHPLQQHQHQDRPPPPPPYSIEKMQRLTREQLGKLYLHIRNCFIRNCFIDRIFFVLHIF